jgi:2-C-methyl-D-erythritol 2,4-cyclodiphosphate synthase
MSIGQDSHRFEPSDSPKPLVLGGVTIPGHQGLKGNSDADVVLHAVTNAVSGISGENILGAVSDKMCLNQGITDSGAYLKRALGTLGGRKLVHVSVSVEALHPKLASHVSAIREHLAQLLDLPVDSVGFTATTGEGLTAFGRGEGIQAFVALTATDEE